MNEKTPPGWGQDDLSQFMEWAHGNCIAAYVNHNHEYTLLRRIDELFTQSLSIDVDRASWFASLFLLRTHSAYRGAIRLAISGQFVEAYSLLRNCIENTLYGSFIFHHPKHRGTWLRRDETSEAKGSVKTVFSYGNVKRDLQQRAADVAARLHTLYERTIGMGAHPNPLSILPSLTLGNASSDRHMELLYLGDDSSTAWDLCVKSTAQVGLCCLEVWKAIRPVEFKSLELDAAISELCVGL